MFANTTAPIHKRCHGSKNKSYLQINTQVFNETSTIEKMKESAHSMVSAFTLTTPPNTTTRTAPLTSILANGSSTQPTLPTMTSAATAALSAPSFLSPAPSPSSSTSSTHSSLHFSSDGTPTASPYPRSVLRNKCQLMRPAAQALQPPAQSQRSCSVTTSSWEGLQSPAASFLASFASPPSTFAPSDGSSTSAYLVQPYEEEQEGDELDDYVMDRMIGFGGFSTVRRGFCISDGHHVAIKIIKFDAAAASAEEDGALPLLLERELSIWKSLCHPNIVCLQKILETDHALYLICDYCSGGSLLSKVKEAHSHGGGGGGWSELEARGIFRDVCQAVSYLHEEAKVCHKDLKLENILLDDQAHCAKVCDFGLALPFGCASSSSSSSAEGRPGGSLAYMSPEQLTTSSTTPTMTSPSSDIWSLGVILYAMVTGKLPFWDEYELRLQQKILIGQYPEPNNASSDVQTLIRGCLNRDPQKRWTIKQVLASSWLKN